MSRSYAPAYFEAQQTYWNRGYIDRKERLPLAASRLAIATFSFAGGAHSVLTDGFDGLIKERQSLVTCATSFLFSVQLRLIDDFKDLRNDSQYRPHRPQRRGLIELLEDEATYA